MCGGCKLLSRDGFSPPLVDGHTCIDSLHLFPCRVRSKEVKKRTLQRIPFSLGPGLEIGVGV